MQKIGLIDKSVS